jgi:hypothetical protein
MHVCRVEVPLVERCLLHIVLMQPSPHPRTVRACQAGPQETRLDLLADGIVMDGEESVPSGLP